MKIFFDSEFSGLHKDTSIISLGMVTDDDMAFYAEFTDYDKKQVENDLWIQENVIDNLLFNKTEPFCNQLGSMTLCKGTKKEIQLHLSAWLRRYSKIELWSDVHHYDVVLLFDLWGHAFKIPENIYYIPFDIATMFKTLGLDPDTSRETFIDKPIDGVKHNALYDAQVIRACYDKLNRNREKYLAKM